jgi:transcriptional regulator with PAS, ATPase and Fis domain
MVGNLKLTLNHIPIIVGDAYTGSIVTFQEISKIQSLEQKIRIKLSEKGFVAKYHFEDIVYRSDVMKVCIERARTFGSYDSSVLITGPSGVGKELFAQSIHNSGMRAEGPFVPINCAALPPSLIESELFGYVEGAFTGAKKGGKIGLFEMAHGGTIFLDEISEMPMDLQGRLLRVIQEREVMRIGGDSVVPVDVRIICATNQALREQVKQHKFRRDLLFRINILSLKIPALHERREDIPELTDQFMEFFRMKYAKERMVLSEDALTYLMHYHYEGNVRELQGMIERAVIVCEDGIIRSSHIVESQQDLPQSQLGAVFYSAEPTLHELEENYIKFIMDKYDHSTSKVCEVLEIDRTTLWRKRKKQK